MFHKIFKIGSSFRTLEFGLLQQMRDRDFHFRANVVVMEELPSDDDFEEPEITLTIQSRKTQRKSVLCHLTNYIDELGRLLNEFEKTPSEQLGKYCDTQENENCAYKLHVHKVYEILNNRPIGSNAVLLLHGTSPSFAFEIAASGFVIPTLPEDELPENRKLCEAIYFADKPAKADQYSTSAECRALNDILPCKQNEKMFFMVVSKVDMGQNQGEWFRNQHLNTDSLSSLTISPTHDDTEPFKEYLIWNAEQAVPKYLIAYSREPVTVASTSTSVKRRQPTEE